MMRITGSGFRLTKAELAQRLCQIRLDLFGEHGGPEIAHQLSLPTRTWLNYERGVTIPGEVLLRFIDLTSAEPRWLLTGQGPRYRSRPSDTKGDRVS